jgi:protein O-mannosyl-transferase
MPPAVAAEGANQGSAPPAGPLRWGAAALLLMALGVHAPSLANGFVYDDAWTLLSNPVVRDVGNLGRLLGAELARAAVPDAGRPTMLASEMLDHAVWGLDPVGFHLQNLLWHAAVVLLFYAALVRLMRSLAVPLGAAALVAVHPLNVEVVAVVNYREDLLATSLLLLALALIEAARAGPPQARGRALALRAGATVAALLACLAKESAYVSALLLVAVDLFRSEPPPLRSRLLDPGLLAAAALAAFAWRWWAVGAAVSVSRSAEVGHHHDLGGALRIGQSAATFFRGALQFLWPAGLAPEYPTPAGVATHPLVLTIAGLAFVAVVTGALLLRRRAPWVTLGLIWAAVAYLPNLGFFPLTNLRADRYFYLPSLGFALTLASGLALVSARMPRLREITVLEVPVLALAGCAALLALSVRTVRQGRVWRNDLAVFSAATESAPDSQRAWLGLAGAQMQAGRLLLAFAASQRGLALGDDFHARQMHGLVLMAQGDLAGARVQLGRALADGPPPHHRAQILNNLGYVELKLGQVDAALGRFALARNLDPWFDRPWLNAAVALADRGNLQAAADLLGVLLTRVPESVDGWKQLGSLHERAGRTAAARSAYQRARSLSPDDVEAARALARLGR